MSTIARTENPEYFNKKVIQKIIELNYPIVKNAIVVRLFIPYFVFLIYYQFMMSIMMEKQGDADESWQNMFYPSIGIILAFSTYFIANEIRQFY